VLRAARVRKGAKGLSVRRALVLAVAALAGCHRSAPEPKLELTGAWLREPERTHGFELREDGVIALLGPSERSGRAWNVSHGELVLSTTSASRAHHGEAADLRSRPIASCSRPTTSRSPGPTAAPSRARARVATYREPIALAPGAQLELYVASGAEPIASEAFAVRAPVPIPFDVSFVPTAGAHYTLALAIREGDRTLFVTPAPLPVTPEGEPLEILLEATR
jgi:uncharacterized lipoprotein YbaY